MERECTNGTIFRTIAYQPKFDENSGKRYFKDIDNWGALGEIVYIPEDDCYSEYNLLCVTEYELLNQGKGYTTNKFKNQIEYELSTTLGKEHFLDSFIDSFAFEILTKINGDDVSNFLAKNYSKEDMQNAYDKALGFVLWRNK